MGRIYGAFSPENNVFYPISVYIAFPCRNPFRKLFRSRNNLYIQFLYIRKTARMIAGLFDYMQNL
jgi:hypothetical protein